MKKFVRSLLAKYMLIIFLAIIILQVSYLIIGTFTIVGSNMHQQDDRKSENDIEEEWHKDAKYVHSATEASVEAFFDEWKRQYPEAGMFWVDGNGNLRLERDVSEKLPSQWNASYTAKFIKSRYNGDPFTVIAFVGDNEDELVVLEIPRSFFDPPIMKISEKYGSLILLGIVSIILLFVIVSFLFFRSIQKRLVQLQDSMELRDVDGLPIEVEITKRDEIGQLENSFNQMVNEIRESRKRELKEEQLRRELIANLSHDLRTPLTKVRAQAYSILQEDLSTEAKQAVKAIEASVEHIDRLIENLMSYTLLVASKYKKEPVNIDIARFVRETIANWYPVFEKEGFEIEVEIEALGEWKLDPIWMGRVLDNLLQNVLRHAKSGKYIAVKTEKHQEYDTILIIDNGPGINNKSEEKGAGIGLSIVDMMVKGMQLHLDIESSGKGTIIRIKRLK
ncbi:HAMP domain-containing histidine kinase [Caldibacillus lycopersici]|uniref:histidine kinase n=1 Tax=Perspicuibacillus lycopersici TaxID=1325689 RepID=A0AAE3IW72_9BACI|nr:HAMP domain-containing sensor histidine kinase [Perspicuibacillus lycopersici]MCU9614526.1 HAMP domain-containing histidine kinase [Perspicuibacillus lycopersici]